MCGLHEKTISLAESIPRPLSTLWGTLQMCNHCSIFPSLFCKRLSKKQPSAVRCRFHKLVEMDCLCLIVCMCLCIVLG